MTEVYSRKSLQTNDAFRAFLKTIDVKAATLHVINPHTDRLELELMIGLPPDLKDALTSIPKGKGLAGEAWRTAAIVSTCNLDADKRVGTAAKTLDFIANYAIPVVRNGHVVSVLGIAFDHDIVLSEAIVEKLRNFALELAD